MTKSRSSYLAVVLSAAVAAGCSDLTRLSPAGPSPLQENAAAPVAHTSADRSMASAADSSTIASWASTQGWSTFADGRVAVADGLLVEGSEVINTVTGTCPTRTITVRGVPVALTAATSFASPLSCAALTSGTAVTVTGLLMYAPGGFSVTATQIAPAGSSNSKGPAVDNKGPEDTRGRQKVAGEGVVDEVSGACPSLTLVIAGHRVQTTRATEYRGGTCEMVRQGTSVKVTAEVQADGSVIAENIDVVAAAGR